MQWKEQIGRHFGSVFSLWCAAQLLDRSIDRSRAKCGCNRSSLHRSKKKNEVEAGKMAGWACTSRRPSWPFIHYPFHFVATYQNVPYPFFIFFMPKSFIENKRSTRYREKKNLCWKKMKKKMQSQEFSLFDNFFFLFFVPPDVRSDGLKKCTKRAGHAPLHSPHVAIFLRGREKVDNRKWAHQDEV